MAQKLVFGYWDVRGIAGAQRALLAHLGVDYEDRQFAFGAAPDFDRSAWTSVKETLGIPFPNLPFIIDGDV
jgi:glutathione S-transferase